MQTLEENKASFKMWLKEFSSALKIKEVFEDDSSKGLYGFLVEFKRWFYDTFHGFLEENKKDELCKVASKYYCDYIEEKILPICRSKIEQKYEEAKSDDSKNIILKNWIDLEDDYMALASYRNLKTFAYYVERDFPKKVWQVTMPLFENLFEYAERVIYGERIELIRASYFPGAGKSYAGNIITAFWFGYDNNMSIIRITYSNDLCKEFIKKTASIINTKRYRKVFPKFDVGEMTTQGNKALYSTYSVELGLQFRFSNETNLYAVTRNGQVTGKRAQVLMIDDLLKDHLDANNEKINQEMLKHYDTEWTARRDFDFQPVIALGTMWSNIDLLNELEYRYLQKSDVVFCNDDKYKYTRVVKDSLDQIRAVFIATPALDYETDESTCPLRYSTKYWKEKREVTDEALWNAEFQQKPAAPEEFIFDYKRLKIYTDDTYPYEEMKNNSTQVYSYFDPTRTGKDYMCLLIFKRYKKNNKWSDWYLIDCLFEQTPHRERYNEIALKIINHKIYKFGFENNVDVSLDAVLKHILKDQNYQEPVRFDSLFSYQNKEGRIFNASPGIRKHIIFPSSSLYTQNSMMGKAMRQITTWSVNQRYGDHDDAPDCLAMFVANYCEDEEHQNTMQVLDRKKFKRLF